MSRFHPLLAEQLFNTVLLAHPEKAMTVARVLLDRWGLEGDDAAEAILAKLPQLTSGRLLGVGRWPTAGSDLGAPTWTSDGAAWDWRGPRPPATPKTGPIDEAAMLACYDSPLMVDAARGIAVIRVEGSLAHKRRALRASSGLQGYDGLAAQLTAAAEDHRVKGVLFDLHSGGGQVYGLFNLADKIAAFPKPTVALVDEVAFSAAYCLAAACDEVWLSSETASVGSIGAVIVHVDFTGKLSKEGIAPTIIRSGARKYEGSELEALSKETRAAWQADIDRTAEAFGKRVAAWRGLSLEAVLGQEGGTFSGEAALAEGLADGIASDVEVTELFAAALQEKAAPLAT